MKYPETGLGPLWDERPPAAMRMNNVADALALLEQVALHLDDAHQKANLAIDPREPGGSDVLPRIGAAQVALERATRMLRRVP